MYVYIYLCIYVYIYIYVCVDIYVYIYRESIESMNQRHDNPAPELLHLGLPPSVRQGYPLVDELFFMGK